jgi:uncharacterized membrane protein YcjF (UPF0283 family)
MTAVSLAIVGLLQLLLTFGLERSTILSRLSRRVFLQAKDSFPEITDLFGDKPGTTEADQTDSVLRVTDLISALLGSALSLMVGAAVAIAIGVIGTQTHQHPAWMVAGAYVAAGICLIALITLLIMILLREVQDHAKWKRIPRKRTVRAVRNALSLRTPDSYKLIVLITSGYLVGISSQYFDPTHMLH